MLQAVGGDLLSDRALNRATLERQLLLRRSSVSPLQAIEHLVGLQAQVPLNPYTGLWSRLEGFRPEELAQLLEDRKVVRIALMRATIHLVSADDALVLRPLVQPVLDAELARHREYAPALVGVDVDAVLDFARPLLAERPRTGAELRALMQQRFDGADGAALAYACRCLLALVQVPPRGVWGRSAQVASTTAESWLGRALALDPSPDDVVLRYLRAFGPAAVADMTTWSRLTGLREVVERLRPRLRVFRDARGRELFDLPDAPRPDPDTPAPPRFLPEYDNAVLSHSDRSRFLSPRRASFTGVSTPIHGSVLCDGVLCGTWRLERNRRADTALVVIDHVVRLPKRALSSVAAEGRRLLRFVAADAASHDVRFVRVE
jgi:Winged helix DNA-binding domain